MEHHWNGFIPSSFDAFCKYHNWCSLFLLENKIYFRPNPLIWEDLKLNKTETKSLRKVRMWTTHLPLEVLFTLEQRWFVVSANQYSFVGTDVLRIAYPNSRRMLFFLGIHSVFLWSLPHDDVIKRKQFQLYWPFVQGIHRSSVNSPHKGQWRGALLFSLICAWTNSWVNNRDAGDLRRHRAHYYVNVMQYIAYA